MSSTCNLDLLTLTLDLPEQLCQMAHLFMMENNNYCVTLFRNPFPIVEVMVLTNLDGRKQAYTPNCLCDNYVSCMQIIMPNCPCDNYVSLTASGLDKNPLTEEILMSTNNMGCGRELMDLECYHSLLEL